MNIIFDERPGKIYDFFKSLWVINNFDEIKKQKEEYGIKDSNDFEKAIGNIIKNESIIDKKTIERYFYKEMKPEYFTGIKDLWENLSLERYLNFVRDLDESSLIMKADQTIQLISKNIYEIDTDGVEVEDVEIVRDRVLDLATNADIPIELKWEFSLFLRNPKEYMKVLGKLINKFLPLYSKVIPKREDVLKTYNEELKKGLNIQGLNYLQEEIDYTYDFTSFEEIKITTTALVSLQIYSEDKTCYVLIGPSIKKAILSKQSEDKVENNLNLINGISESTRYKILQLLSERQYYGQEIADVLNITKTTTFYHLNFLISLGVIKLEKDCQKNYYSLNKEILLKNIEDFKNNMKLI